MKPSWKSSGSGVKEEHWLQVAPWITVIVYRRVHLRPDLWLLSCYPVQITQRPLNAKDIEDAKREALAVVWRQVEKAYLYLDKAMG